MCVRDPELVALLHRLEDIADRETSLDHNELFHVLERVERAQERICVSKLLARILKGAREHEEGARDGSADTMAAVRALVVSSIEPLVATPFDTATVARGLLRLASKLQEFHGGSTAVRIPRDFHMEDTDLMITRVEDGLLITRAPQVKNVADWWGSWEADPGFMAEGRQQPAMQARDFGG
jgi:virulence-associated protein VagC